MKLFYYKGLDSDFIKVKGKIEEKDIQTAKERLKSRKISIINIYPKKDISVLKSKSKKIKDEELINYCNHMATMIESGVNVIISLDILAQQSKEKEIKKIYEKVLKSLKKGNTLSDSMKSTSQFPELLVDMIKAGELSGNIDKMFYNMAEYYERDFNVRNKIKSATIYPKILIVATIGIILFFYFFIIPKFKDFFNEMENLPFATRMLLGTTKIANNNFIIIIAIVALCLTGIILLNMYDKMKVKKDYFELKLPVFGLLKKYIITSRITSTMAFFFKSGIPINYSLNKMKLIINNRYILNKFNNISDQIMTGSKISDAFENEEIFEPIVCEMIRIGEQTGRLDEMLYKLSLIYDKKIENNLRKLMSKLGPVLTLVIGLLVGFILIAIAVPILSISHTIG